MPGQAAAHVFVCYGVVSFEAAVCLAERILTPADRVHLLLLFEADEARIPAGVDVHAMPRRPHELSEWTKPFFIAAWTRAVLGQIEAAGVQRIVAYLPHPFELPANHFAYSDPRVERLELLPDGLINYVSTPVGGETLSKKIRYWVRSALRVGAAWSVGLRYRPLRSGHLTQFEQLGYARCWAQQEKGYLTRRGEFASLPREAHSARARVVPGQRPIVLVLDQELNSLVDRKMEASLRSAVAEAVKALAPERVYYKSHPRGINRHRDLRAEGIAAVDVTGPESAEGVVDRLGASHLVGYYSTPLILLGDEVQERISIMPRSGARGIRKPAYVEELRLALSRAGVEVRAP